jgi:hypothetical protein
MCRRFTGRRFGKGEEEVVVAESAGKAPRHVIPKLAGWCHDEGNPSEERGSGVLPLSMASSRMLS